MLGGAAIRVIYQKVMAFAPDLVDACYGDRLKLDYPNVQGSIGGR